MLWRNLKYTFTINNFFFLKKNRAVYDTKMEKKS